jgi:hypothetical protein
MLRTLTLLVLFLVVWFAFTWLVLRFTFTLREAPLERMEDMMNDGCQTSILLLGSGLLAGLTVVIGLLFIVR